MMMSSSQHRWFICSIITIFFTSFISEGHLEHIVDVRLINGQSRYEGTVEYTINNITWQTLCGDIFDFFDAKLVCEHIGAKGTNKAFTDSPFGSNLDPPTRVLSCQPAAETISDCDLNTNCVLPTNISAAICYGETYFGCFKDNVIDRVLPSDPLQDANSMTIDKCISHCRESIIADYVYAGVEFGSECYCGVAGTNYSRLGAAKNGDGDCQTQCTGNPESSCGGSGHIAVFNVSVPTTPPPTTSTVMTTTVTSSPPLSTTTGPTEGGTWLHTTVTSELSTDSTTSAEIDTTVDFRCPQCPDICPQVSHGPSIGLGVLVLLSLVYGALVTVYTVGLRRSLKERQLAQQETKEDETYTKLNHQSRPITRARSQEIPMEGESNHRITASQSEAIADHQLYVSPEQVEQRWKEQEATPPGVHGEVPAHYESVIKK